MKTVIKLLLVALVLNAVVQAGSSAMRHYQFEDAARQAALFGSKLSDGQLHERIMTLAEAEGIPLERQDLVVSRDPLRTTIEGAYVDEVELVPRVYVYPHTWEFSLEVLTVEAR